MYKKLRNNTEGFTIVETLIVLAIAATIIVVVLLAVPALQRSSRNTQAKSAATITAAAINDYSSNNNGGMPSASVFTTDAAGTTPITTTTNAAGQFYIGKSPVNIPSGLTVNNIIGNTSASTGGTVAYSSGKIAVVLGSTCPTPNTPAANYPYSSTTYSANSAAVIYPIEGSSTVGCVQG